jgi:hypothetical protein
MLNATISINNCPSNFDELVLYRDGNATLGRIQTIRRDVVLGIEEQMEAV